MVLLPTPLKAFTDVMPEVKAMLRTCALHTYGWRCELTGLAKLDAAAVAADPAYPVSWPRKIGDPVPPGTIPLTAGIVRDAHRRLARIRRALQHAGPFYLREQVITALSHWGIDASAPKSV